MADRDSVLDILNDAVKREKMAEDNCATILKELKINGFHDAIESIENDEIRHQEMVKQLIKLL